MKKAFLIAIACLAATAVTSQAQLIAGWDFQTITNNGTALLNAPNTPKVIVANFGAGTIYLDGTNGSSSWNSTASNPELTSFSGTAVNAGAGFSTTTSGNASLALANSSSNGKALVFSLSTTGFTDPISITYASQRSNTGFTTQAWDFSLNGTDWTSLQTITTIAGSFGLISLNNTSAISDKASVFLRLTVTGATAAAGNNRLDNIQIAAVPEPGTVALIAVGLGAVLFGMRRRKSA